MIWAGFQYDTNLDKMRKSGIPMLSGSPLNL